MSQMPRQAQSGAECQDVERVLIPAADIAARTRELGQQITADYAAVASAGERIVLVGILRGAFIFAADLARSVKLPIEIDFMAVSSYGSSSKSSGTVRIQSDLRDSCKGAHLILVEDVLDTGLTLKSLERELSKREPASMEIACLLRKDVGQQIHVDAKYVGFACEDEFLVGYGLDYAERYRNLPDICVLKHEVYE